MAIDVQRAFARLIDTFEDFHAAVVASEDPESPDVLAALGELADAYTIYDDAIFREYGVEGPFDTYVDDDDDFDGEDDDDDDDDLDDFEDDDLDEDSDDDIEDDDDFDDDFDDDLS